MEECSVLIETTKSLEDKTLRQFDYMDLQPEVQMAYKDLVPYFCYFALLVEFTKSSQKNQHSPIDSANNKCYITTRTKEGEQKEMIKIPPTGV